MNDKIESQKSLVLNYLCSYVPRDDHVLPFLVLSIGRVLLKASRSGKPLSELVSGDEIRRIHDWLKASMHEDAEWLGKLDKKGRPKKLLKFGDIKQILQEADKGVDKSAQMLPSQTNNYNELKIEAATVGALHDGMTVKSLDACKVSLESIPLDLVVEEELRMTHSFIPVLADTMKLPASANFFRATIAEMRGDLVFDGGRKHSTVNFGMATIDKLPNSITVIDGNLDLSCTNISSLPKKLFATSDIYLCHMKNLEEFSSDCDLECRDLVIDCNPPMPIPDNWIVNTVVLDTGKERIFTADEYRSFVERKHASRIKP